MPVTAQPWPNTKTTPHTTSPENGTEMASKKHGQFLKGVNPQVSREHALCQEAQQGLKTQANHAKAERTCGRHQGPSEAPGGEAQDAKGPQPQTHPSCFHCSPKAWEAD